MKYLRHKRMGAGWFARRRKSPAAMLVALLLVVAQVQTAAAAIINDAIATASYAGNPVNSNTGSASIPVIAGAAGMTVTKTGVLNDDDGTPGLSAGDTISYTVNVENTGNISLTNVLAVDPLVTLNFVSGDIDTDNQIDPGETWIYSGNYTILQSDIDTNGGGDSDIDNTVTISSTELADQNASHAVVINPNLSMTVTKTGVLNDNDGIAGLSAGDTIDYVIDVENTGIVTLTNVVITDILDQNGNSEVLATSGPSGDANFNNRIDPGEIWQYTATHIITQANIDDGNDLVNTTSVTTNQVGPQTGVDTQILSGFVNDYTMTKSAALADGDGDALGDAGEIITYSFSFTNTGNLTLTNLAVSDPLPGLSVISCAGDGDSDGDIDSLAPGATIICSATYTIDQADVDAGSLTNTATTSATRFDGVTPVVEDDSANDNSATVLMDRDVGLVIEKTASVPVAILPNVYEFQYVIQLTNTGSATLTNLRLQDDIASAVNLPASLLVPPTAVIAGFSGTGGLNGGYDGSLDTELLAGDVQLGVAQSASVTITVRVDTRGQAFTADNTAFGSATEFTGTVPSDDPGETPGNPDDVNPTPVAIPDTDADGSPDGDESSAADRDGDGNPDAFDYDPTGYFYCEDDGQILSGGLISIQNLSAGGTQTGLGSSNNITILRDGSNGSYQFYVTAPGTYRLIPNLPSTGTASTSLLSSGSLDVTSLLPSNPGVIGSGEFGSTGVLSNFSAAVNPFFTDFVFENGDPVVFNNNIPLGLCGSLSLAATKELVSGPTLLADGTSDVGFRLTVENTGTGSVDDVNLADDLAGVFGAGNYVITSRSIESAPPGFGASLDPFFDGDGSRLNLTTGGLLLSGESVSILLNLNVDVVDGVYTNSVVASGVSPLDGSLLPEVTANVDVSINRLAAVDGLVASKTALLETVRLGSIVPYTIVIENNSTANLVGIDIVDFMPAGFTYVVGSAVLDSVSIEPVISGRELVWAGQGIAANSSLTLKLSLAVGAAAPGKNLVNSAFVRNPFDGSTLSNVARAVVRLEVEPVLQCSDIIGRVFDDLDGDGYYDDGEPGLAGVRIASVRGLLITTDEFGRYHVACGAIPYEQTGSNYILKLDTRTLPTGYSVTSENPRVIRVTQGKLSKINFAASINRIVRLEITDNSFRARSTGLTRSALRDIARIIPLLEESKALLKLDYRVDGQPNQLQRTRLRAVKALIAKAWASRTRPFKLEIEAELNH